MWEYLKNSSFGASKGLSRSVEVLIFDRSFKKLNF